MLLITNDISHKEIELDTKLQATAVEINYPFKTSICIIYLPDQSWSHRYLKSLSNRIPNPSLILENYDCRDTAWGSQNSYRKGKRREEICDEMNPTNLNSGEPTRFRAASGTFGAIDLAIGFPGLSTELTRRTLEDLHRINHFPIVITTTTRRFEQNRNPRRNLNKAE